MVLSSSWDLVEADLQRYYSLDLPAEFEVMSARRLSVLVDGLPPDSALHRDGRMWTLADELAAVAVEDNAAWLRLLLSIQVDEPSKKKLPPATVLKHPDRVVAKPERKRNVVSDPAELARLFGGR